MSSQTLRFSPEILRQRRLDADFTVTKLAASVGVSADTLWTWERGQRSPRADHLASLSVSLRCPIDELFDFVNDDAPAREPGRLDHADATPAATQLHEERSRGHA